MDGDQNGTVTVDTEQCSSNMYFTLAGKQHPDEVFNIQFTVRGNPSASQLKAHLQSVIQACGAVVGIGGHAKQVGQQPAANGNGASKPAGSQWEFYKGAKGKTFIRLPEGVAEPNEITCPLHSKPMKRKTNDNGAWYSHKDGENWCSIAVPGGE